MIRTYSHPFEVRPDRVITLPEGDCLAHYVELSGVDIRSSLVILNGGIIPIADWTRTYLKDGDDLIIKPLVAGSSGGKTALRILVSVAVVIASILVPGLGIVAGAWATAAFVGGVAAAGAAIQTFAIGTYQHIQNKDTSTYSWNGVQTTAEQGGSIPKLYGSFTQGGNIIASYVETLANREYLNILIDLGWGPLKNLTRIQIDGNDLATYDNATYEIRNGYSDQTVCQDFTKVINQIAVNQRVRCAPGYYPVTVDGVQNDTVAAEIEFFFPNGLWAGPNSDGSYDSWACYFQVDYQKVSDPGWTTYLMPGNTTPTGGASYWIGVVQDMRYDGGRRVVLLTDNVTTDHYVGQTFTALVNADTYNEQGVQQQPTQITVTGTWQLNPNCAATLAPATGINYVTPTDWSTIACSFESNQGPVPERYVFAFNLPSPGQYNYRITKLGANQHAGGFPQSNSDNGADEISTRRGEQSWIAAVREINYNTFTYPNHVLLAMRVLATDKISGSSITVSCITTADNAETQGYTYAVKYDRPKSYYRCSESSGNPVDVVGSTAATYGPGVVSRQQKSLVVNSPDTSILIAANAALALQCPIQLTAPYTLELLVSPSSFGGTLFSGTASPYTTIANKDIPVTAPTGTPANSSVAIARPLTVVTGQAAPTSPSHMAALVDGEAVTAASSAANMTIQWADDGSPIPSLNKPIGALWSGFTAPVLPSDAVISGIYPVLSANFSTPLQDGTCSASVVVPGAPDTVTPFVGFNPSNVTAPFLGPSIGTNPALIATMDISAQLTQINTTAPPIQGTGFYTPGVNTAPQMMQLNITFVGYIVYYTSASLGAGANTVSCVVENDGTLLLNVNGVTALRTVTPIALNQSNHLAFVFGAYGVEILTNGVHETLTCAPFDLQLAGFCSNYVGLLDEVVIYDQAVQLGRLNKHYLDSTSWHNALENYPANIQPVIVLDMFTNILYGGGIGVMLLDPDFFLAWADRCMEPIPDGGGGLIQRFEYNGLLDTTKTLWDQAGAVAHTGGASLVRNGVNYTGVLDAPGTPSQLFNVANMVKGTFEESWANTDNRANSLDVVFYDENNFYLRTVLNCQVTSEINGGKPIVKAAQADLRGCSNISRAWHYGNFSLKSTQALVRTIKFDAFIDSIACSLGDVVLIQHDLPQWGSGGKVLDGCTQTVIHVDKDLALVDGETFTLMVVLHNLVTDNVQVTNIAPNNYVSLNANLADPTHVDRFVCNGVDYEIVNTGSNWVQLANTVGLANGMSGQVIALNYLVQSQAQSIAGRWVTLASPLPAAPAMYDNYSFGTSSSQPQPFHVVNISRKKDLTATLSLCEYQESVYTDDLPNIFPGAITSPDNVSVTNLAGNEQFSPDLLNIAYAVSWTPNVATAGVRVLVSRNGGPATLVYNGPNTSYVIDGIFTGDSVTVTVIGYSVNLVTATQSGAPSITATIVGYGSYPANVTGFMAVPALWNNLLETVTFTWNANPEANIDHYSVYFMPSVSANPTTAQLVANQGTGLPWVADIPVAGISNPPSMEMVGISYLGVGTYFIRAVNTAGYGSLVASAHVLTSLDFTNQGNTWKSRNAGNTLVTYNPTVPWTASALPDGTGEITTVQFIAQCSDMDISVLSAAYIITGLVQGQGYYLYYDDPTFSGGAVTIQATQNAADLKAVGRFILSAVPVLVPANPGSGAPSGTTSMATIRPSAFTLTGATPPTSPELAFDGNNTTYCHTNFNAFTS